MRIVLPFLLTASVCGCATFGGDLPIRVSGTLPENTLQSPPAECSIGIALAGSNDVKARRKIVGTFDATFIVEARAKQYRFVASCDGGWTFESLQFTLGDKGSFNKRIDLGKLH